MDYKNMNDKIKELAESFGWIDLGKQKNKYMISFRHEEKNLRMNIYPSTMTVTVQKSNGERGFLENAKEVTLEKLEEILCR